MRTALELELEVAHNPTATVLSGNSWSSEFKLLLACCAYERDESLPELLCAEPQWPVLLRLAENHQVIPRVYDCISSHSDLLPRTVVATLQSAYTNHARKCLRFTGELTRILHHLQTHGIYAVPYKGPVLAQVLYGDVTARQYSDLDVLVSPQDVTRTRIALAELRYKTHLELTPWQERAYIRSGYEYSFDGALGNNSLELQWRILPRFYVLDLNVEAMFDRTHEIQVGGEPVRTLSNEDLLIVLCIHAAKHVWAKLCWLCDIAQLGKSSVIDWSIISDRTSQLGIARIVAVSLLLATKLLGVTLPAAAENLKQVRAAEEIANAAMRTIVSSDSYDTESPAYFRLMLRLRERCKDRARFLWRLALTPGVGEWEALHLPRLFSPLYHVVRMGRLAKRFSGFTRSSLTSAQHSSRLA